MALRLIGDEAVHKVFESDVKGLQFEASDVGLASVGRWPRRPTLLTALSLGSQRIGRSVLKRRTLGFGVGRTIEKVQAGHTVGRIRPVTASCC
jgi:hypothetical protein